MKSTLQLGSFTGVLLIAESQCGNILFEFTDLGSGNSRKTHATYSSSDAIYTLNESHRFFKNIWVGGRGWQLLRAV